MKKRVRKLFLMASILCVVSLVVCACGGKKHSNQRSQVKHLRKRRLPLQNHLQKTLSRNGKTAIRIWKEVLRNSRKDSSQLQRLLQKKQTMAAISGYPQEMVMIRNLTKSRLHMMRIPQSQYRLLRMEGTVMKCQKQLPIFCQKVIW